MLEIVHETILYHEWNACERISDLYATTKAPFEIVQIIVRSGICALWRRHTKKKHMKWLSHGEYSSKKILRIHSTSLDCFGGDDNISLNGPFVFHSNVIFCSILFIPYKLFNSFSFCITVHVHRNFHLKLVWK